MKKILITGANGFVGLHLINLLAPDYSIIGLTHAGDLTNSENKTFYNGNILDENFLDEIIQKHKPEIIFHLAAIATTHTNQIDAVFKINLFGTINLYKAVLKLKEKDGYNPKIVFVSSAEVYGKTSSSDKINENSPLMPVSFYGSSKLSADKLSYQLSQSHKLNTVILRPFNHTGPGQQKGFFVPDMASQIVELEKNPSGKGLMVGSLNSIRDFTDVRDIVRGYKKVLEKDVAPGEVFNICSGTGRTMQSVLDILLENSTGKIIVKTDPERIRLAEITKTVGDNSKFSETFGWKPEIKIEQTAKDVLDYWRAL